jgi:hypothetical protein
LLFLAILPGTPSVAVAGNAQNNNPVLVFSHMGIHYFQPQIPNFDLVMPKFNLKVCLNVSKHEKDTQIHIKLESKHHSITNHQPTHFS